MQNNMTLVIMAAGLGSRYKNGIKQLAKIGPSGENLMDYSINDAIEAGFNKVVFVIRHDIEKEFKEEIGNRIAKVIDVCYVYQELNDLPKPFIQGERKKPWGTVHAILSCKGVVNEPFCVINADDFYGKEGFKKIADFLNNNKVENEFCMAGYILKNTMSENGGVNRGICEIDENSYLSDVKEIKEIKKENNVAIGFHNDKKINIDLNSHVSMNLWGFKISVFEMFDNYFIDFLKNLSVDDLESECLIPVAIDKLIKEGKIKVKLLETDDRWFGITYQEDKEITENEIRKLIKKGFYKESLYTKNSKKKRLIVK